MKILQPPHLFEKKAPTLSVFLVLCTNPRRHTEVCLQGMGGRRTREIVAKRYEASSLPCASSIENSFCPSAQCLGCSTIKVNLRGRTQSQYVFSHTSTKMCSYFYINICVSGARYYFYHKDKVSVFFSHLECLCLTLSLWFRGVAGYIRVTEPRCHSQGHRRVTHTHLAAALQSVARNKDTIQVLALT